MFRKTIFPVCPQKHNLYTPVFDDFMVVAEMGTYINTIRNTRFLPRS